jgi:hypothetical protein
MSSTRTPQITPLISAREGFGRGAFAKTVSRFVSSSSRASIPFWLYPVSQRITSSTSAFVRPFFSAFST